MAALPSTVVRDFAFTFCTLRVNFLALFHLHHVHPLFRGIFGLLRMPVYPPAGVFPPIYRVVYPRLSG